MRELKADKKKGFKIEAAYITKVGSFNTPNPFNFDFSFSILTDVISDNTLIPFL